MSLYASHKMFSHLWWISILNHVFIFVCCNKAVHICRHETNRGFIGDVEKFSTKECTYVEVSYNVKP